MESYILGARPFYRSHITRYSSFTALFQSLVPFARYSKLFVKVAHVAGAPVGVTPLELT